MEELLGADLNAEKYDFWLKLEWNRYFGEFGVNAIMGLAG